MLNTICHLINTNPIHNEVLLYTHYDSYGYNQKKNR